MVNSMSNKQTHNLTEEQLVQLSHKEENEHIEKCESPVAKDKIAKAICAFSNNIIGTKEPIVIFIGIKDNGECAGLTVTDRMLQSISSIRSDGNLQPFPIISVQKIIVNGYEVIAVTVQTSKNPPVRYEGRCWVRVGPSVRQASEEEEQRLVERRQASHLPYDMQGIQNSTIESDLNMEYFKTQYLPSTVSSEVLGVNNRDLKMQMRSLRLLNHEYIPTVTALLVMGKNPMNWSPGAYIQFIRFEGKELTDTIRDQKVISGTLPDQIIQIEKVLSAHISTSLELSDTKHIQSSDYPIRALSQLVRNAVIHRIYQSNTPVKVYWFSDRIEIQSPGGPFGEVNVDNFGQEGLTSYRNPTIAEAFKNLEFIEKFGFGIPQAREALKENGNPKLKLVPKESTVLVIIKKK